MLVNANYSLHHICVLDRVRQAFRSGHIFNIDHNREALVVSHPIFWVFLKLHEMLF